MPAHLGILCHLEPLPRYRRDVHHFSLNVAPVVVEPDADEALGDEWAELLQPWSSAWLPAASPPHGGICLFVEGRAEPLAGDVVPVEAEVNDDWLRGDLEHRYGQLRERRGTDAFLWSLEPVVSASPVDGEAPWHTLLANAMRYPAPLPRTIGLSHVFTVPAHLLTGAARLFAAPVLAHAAPAGVPAEQTPAQSPPSGNRQTLFAWEYAVESGGRAVRAYSPMVEWTPREEEEAQAARSGYFDLSRLLVRHAPETPSSPPGTAGTYAGDWTAEMRERLAHAFDLPQRLIDFLREHPEVPFDEDFRDAVLATLRDTAGTGLLPLPDGGTVAGDLLARLNPATAEQRAAFLETIGVYEASFGAGGGLKEWTDLLREVPELSGLAVLPAPGEGSPPTTLPGRERALEELEQLQSALSRDEVAGALLLRQWRKAVENAQSGSPPAPEFWERHAGALRDAILPATPLRELLLRASFADAWKRLLRLDPDAPDEHEEVRLRVGRLLEIHFAVRCGLSLPADDPFLDDWNALQASYALHRRPALSGLRLPAEIGAWLRDWGETFASARVLPPAADQPRPTSVPHPLSVQVVRLAGASQGEGEDDWDDELRQVAGVGLLMREDRAGSDWRCLNLADVVPGEPGAGAAEAAVRYAVVPWRLQYQDELRQCLVSYDNQPLIADSPAGGLAGTVRMQHPDPQTPRGSAELFHYAVSPLPGGGAGVDPERAPWGLLPALKFGSTYEILPFLVATSGALPPLIADPDDPTRICPHHEFAGRLEALGERATLYVRDGVPYDRRVRVGQVRCQAPGATSPDTSAALPLPRFPETVVPLAHDLRGHLGGDPGAPVHPPLHPRVPLASERVEDDEAAARNPGSPPGADAPPLRDAAPLVLLWRGDGESEPSRAGPHRFAFAVRKPATDLITWDRWVAGLDGILDQRKRVWADVHRRNAGRAAAAFSDASPDAPLDASLDDPAVDGFFVELLPRYSRVGAAPPPVRVPLGRAAAGGLAGEQADALPVVCALIVDGGPALATGATGVVVRVPEGEVWELRVHATVPAAVADPRLIGPILDEAMEIREGGKRWYCFSPLRLLVEGATDAMPEPKDLWDALQVGLDRDDSAVTVRLDPGRLVRPDGAGTVPLHLAPYLKTVEVRRQMWRWNGRHADPGTPPPFGTVLDPVREDPSPEPSLTPAMRWEVGAFSGRRDSDHLLIRAQVSFTDPPRYDGPGVDGSAGHPPLFREAFADDPRARYYRFSVRALSRYHGLFPEEKTVREGRFSDALPTPWRRVLSRARPGTDQPGAGPQTGEAVRVPLVRLVVPLTEAAGADVAGAPTLGLLVVLDETWYDAYGLAEELQVAVDYARDPLGDAPGSPDPRFLEFGPDPILSGEGLDQETVDLEGYRLFSSDFASPPGTEPEAASPPESEGLRVTGPIGYTFDTDTDAPLFVRSSFLVEAVPPARWLDEGRLDLSWFFLKLRFRRRLRNGSFIAPRAQRPRAEEGEALPDDPEGWTPASDWTLPLWTQLVPAASRYEVLSAESGTPLQVGLDGVGLRLAGRRLSLVREGAPVRLAAPGEAFRLWAVVTRRITDVLGHPQESFVDLRPLRDGVCELRPGVLAGAGDAEALRLRVLEVQRPRQAGGTWPDEDDDGMSLSLSLFGSAPPGPGEPPRGAPDARARIVRVSAPVDAAP